MTKEEVIIAMGLDNSGVQSGLVSVDSLMKNSVGATLKGIKNLMKVNLVGFVVSELIPAWDKFTQNLANIETSIQEGIGRGLDIARKKYKQMLKEQREEDAANEKAKAQRVKGLMETIDIQREANELATENALSQFSEEEAMKKRIQYAEQERKSKEETFRTLEKILFVGGNLQITDQQRRDLAIADKEFQEAQKKENDLRKQQTNAEEQKKRAIEATAEAYQKSVKTAQQANDTSQNRLDQGVQSRGEFTLEDLAQNQGRRTRWGRMANRALQLEQWGRWNAEHGNIGLAKSQLTQGEKLRDQLAKENPFLKDPLGELKKDAARTANALADITKTGVKVLVPED